MEENKIIDFSIETKKKFMGEFIDLVITNVTKYYLEHEQEIMNAIVNDEFEKFLDRFEEETGCEFTDELGNENSVNMMMEMLADHLNNMLGPKE